MNETSDTQDTRQNWGRLGRSILNGVIGDYLEKENNPLAIQMGFYYEYKRLKVDSGLVHQLDHPLTNKVVVLVHGLTNTESIWDFPNKKTTREDAFVDHYIDSCFETNQANTPENYGSKLQQDFGYTPFFLRYNTGLSLEKNGRLLAKQLSQLVDAYPIRVDELMLVGFSMGGLLIRYAQHSALASQPAWLKKLSKCMYLGTPHEGSPLEKFGYFSGEVVRHIPKDYVSHWADWIDRRSEGIQDLRHGLKFLGEGESYNSSCASFYQGARHYFVSGSIGQQENSLIGKLFGDTLVRQGSAYPDSAPANSQNAHFEGLPHIPLAHSERVYEQLKAWVEEDELRHRRKGGRAREIVRFEELRRPYVAENEQHDLSNQALIAGSIDLLASAYDKTLETVETMHYSVSEEPFYVLQKLPLLSQLAKPVEAAHRGVLDLVYKSLRSGGKQVHRAAKWVAPDDIAPNKAV